MASRQYETFFVKNQIKQLFQVQPVLRGSRRCHVQRDDVLVLAADRYPRVPPPLHPLRLVRHRRRHHLEEEAVGRNDNDTNDNNTNNNTTTNNNNNINTNDNKNTNDNDNTNNNDTNSNDSNYKSNWKWRSVEIDSFSIRPWLKSKENRFSANSIENKLKENLQIQMKEESRSKRLNLKIT